jgi:hypothetical protein
LKQHIELNLTSYCECCLCLFHIYEL